MIIVSVLLILIVLVQNPKGGGLSNSFSGSTQIMSVKNQKDRLSKTTWIFAGVIFFLCIISSSVLPNRTAQNGTRIKTENIQDLNTGTGIEVPESTATPMEDATATPDAGDNNEVK
ncbi:preprotein translocase subunit SecG [Halosquirtibacter xylanolyticus]|nr:preprotein translocase subunit SecG [Prolixibacteraceae bacterium]